MALSPAVMGVVNVTPDSFFPDSRTVQTELALERGRAHFAAGCDVVDVGGESTRPGASDVDEALEIERVVPVVSVLSLEGPVSIDTQKAGVARAAVRAGATIINDVSCTLVELAGSLGVGYVAMHRKGTARTMNDEAVYDDVVREVSDFLRVAAQRARDAGVERLWLDPGIGFAKTARHNYELLARCDELASLAREFGAGLLIGTSRKRFLGDVGARELSVDERLEGSIATEAWAMLNGATMVRVHDVIAAVQLRELVVRPVEEVVA